MDNETLDTEAKTVLRSLYQQQIVAPDLLLRTANLTAFVPIQQDNSQRS